MGSVVQEAARGMIHQLGGIQVLRLASVLYLFATTVAAADRAPDSPVYSRRAWQSADGPAGRLCAGAGSARGRLPLDRYQRRTVGVRCAAKPCWRTMKP